MGMHFYVGENAGRLPPDLAEIGVLLGDDESIPVDLFVRPRTDGSQPAMDRLVALAAQKRWVNENAHYVYAGAGLKLTEIRDASRTPIIWENPSLTQDGINIAFADGHVQWVEFPGAFEILERAPNRN
jgi:prepilin-type processing-associated H-X9-DG protein